MLPHPGGPSVLLCCPIEQPLGCPLIVLFVLSAAITISVARLLCESFFCLSCTFVVFHGREQVREELRAGVIDAFTAPWAVRCPYSTATAAKQPILVTTAESYRVFFRQGHRRLGAVIFLPKNLRDVGQAFTAPFISRR